MSRHAIRRRYVDNFSKISRMIRKGLDLIKPYAKIFGKVVLKILRIGSELAKYLSTVYGLRSVLDLIMVRRQLDSYRMTLDQIDQNEVHLHGNLNSMSSYANMHFGIKLLKAAAAFGIAEITSIISAKALRSKALSE